MSYLCITNKLKISHILLPGFILCVCLFSFIRIDSANAAHRPANNASEQAAHDLCMASSGRGKRGAIWFNTPSASYYDDQVNIASEANSVEVYIRGSFFSCGSGGNQTLNAWYINYAPYKIPRLSAVGDATVLDRGATTSSYNFSSQGGSVSATLDVSGLAMDESKNSTVPGCDSSTSYCESLTVSLYRCPVTNSPPSTECYTSDLTINIVREKKIILPWGIDGSSSVSVGGGDGDTDVTTVTPGQTVAFSHSLTVTGPGTATVHWGIRRGNASDPGETFQSNTTGISGIGKIVSINRNEAIGGGSASTNGMTQLIGQGNVGTTTCQWIEWDPRSSSDATPIGVGRACAKIPYNFTLTAGSSVVGSSETLDSTIKFHFTITNGGPTKVQSVIYSTSVKRVTSTGYPDIDIARGGTEVEQNVGSPSIDPAITGNDEGGSVQFANFDGQSHTITQDDVGNWICGIIAVNPHSSGDSTDTFSHSCKYIPYSYTLTPTITIPSKVVEDGSSFLVTSKIAKSGATKSKTSYWDLVEVVTTTAGKVISTPKGSGSYIFSDNNPVFLPIIQTPPVVAKGDAGTKYCYTLSVSPKSGVDDGTVSDQECITIGKRPKVQIWGGNLLAGGLINTSTSIKDGRMFGSWTEYGVLANGLISGMASGSAFASKLGMVKSSNACDYSTLSFTNVPSKGTGCPGADGTIGNYKISGITADIAASFPGDSAISGSVANDYLSGPGTFIGSKAGPITLGASTLDKGKSVILKVAGTVTISGNQFYSNVSYDRASQLPQLIIIADNINIEDNVTNIDAWLITKGDIKTCSNIPVPLTVAKCSQSLTINGPVIANRLFLNRTAGSETGDKSGNPAEIFNLRADAYLWAAAHIQSSVKVQSVYTTELPPRF